MNNHTIEPAGALPSYDVKDLVVFLPEDTHNEVVCEVVGHRNTSTELLYNLKDPLTGQEYQASFRCLQPHIEADPDDPDDPDDFARHDYGEQGCTSFEEMLYG